MYLTYIPNMVMHTQKIYKEDERIWKVYCASVFMTLLKEEEKKNLFPFLQRLFITSISDNIQRVRNLIIKRKSKKKEWNEAMIKTHRHVMCSDIFFPLTLSTKNNKNKPLRKECDCKYETSHKNDDNCCAIKTKIIVIDKRILRDSSRMIISRLF